MPVMGGQAASMNEWLKLAGPALIFVLAVPVHASGLSDSRESRSDLDATAIELPELTVSEKVRSRDWGLSKAEWHRYRRLMQGIRGSISPASISPIEVLGIHARDPQERRRYAERWAHTMHEDADRILAFQRAYDEAMRRLYPNEPLIDVNRLNEPGVTAASHSTHRLLFFTRLDCPECDVVLGRLLSRMDQVEGIDIYVDGEKAGDDDAVRAWAARQSIKGAWVRSRRITLNYDDGTLARLTSGQGDPPALFRRVGTHLTRLEVSDL